MKLQFSHKFGFPVFLFIFTWVIRAIYSYRFQWLAGDSYDYIEIANGIPRFEFSLGGQPTTFRPPLYPLLISIFPALPMNWTLDGLTAVIVYFVSQGTCRERE